MLKNVKSLKVVSLSDIGNKDMGKDGKESRFTT